MFAARNAGVTVSDIQFETSESTGVTTSKEESVTTPSVAILSSNTVGTDTYEYIYLPNISGQVTVSANGTEYYNGSVEANSVLRVNVPMSIGTNTVTSSLVPDESQSLTSYNTITKNTTVEYQILAQGREYVYVSPDGSQSAAGTSADPMDIYTAVKYAAPGQYIILKDGTYTNGDVKIQRSVSGTAQKPIYLVAEHDGGVIFEKMALSVIASYWHVYGIYVHYPNSVGIQISGNYNVIEMCTVEGSKNTGIQISRSGSSDRIPGIAEMLWPSYNLVKNCESFDNCDSGRNDADGFAAKLTCGEGNTFYGCIAHNNIDDGWDLFAKAISGEIGQVTIENCIAYNNGWLTTEDTTADGYEYGEGNGFKLGGNDMYGGHILRNSIAFGNIGKGITSNSCPDCKVYNCISYGNAVGSNSAYNISLATKSSNKQLWEVEGLISYTTYTTTADQIPSSFLTSTNYLYNGSYSRNSKAVKVSGDWFESTDLSIVPTRNADGTINMHSLLVVTDACPSDTGARLDLTSDAAISVNPLTKNVATSTNSSSSSESSATESSSDSSSTTSSQVVSLPINVVVNAGETKINGLDTMIMTLNSAKTMQASFINRLRAQKLYVLASVNKEVGFSIATADLTGDVEDINVKSEMTQMPGFAAGYVTKKLSFEKTKSLGFNIGIHMNVGAENVGKTAYIFQVNLTTGQPELVSSMIVNEIGNVMLNTKEISNIYVLIAQ